MIHIGIDPDLHKSGVAIMTDGKYADLKAMDFPSLLQLFEQYAFDPLALFVIEDVNAHRAMYAKHDGTRSNAKLKIAQNVGMVKAIGIKLIEMLVHYGCRYELVKPLTGTLKLAKNDKHVFERLTGWKKASNQDTRDAAMLIYKYAK